jgi:hypothetical protein
MENVSVNGSSARLVASFTFPAGFDLIKFADDADPFDITDNTVASHGSGINGDLVVWSNANGIEISVSVLPNTDEGRNMAILWSANKVAVGKVAVKDILSLIITLPNGDKQVFSGGALLSGPAGISGSSDGRQKTQTYSMVFEKRIM